MRNARRLLVAAVGLAVFASAAHAVINANWIPIANSPDLPGPDYSAAVMADPIGGAPLASGHETWDLTVTLSAGDKWTVAGLYVPRASLGAGGTFFNTPLGSNTRPNFILFFAPATDFDTYVDSFGGGVNIAGPAVGTDPFSPIGLPDVNVAWGTNAVSTDPAGPASYRIARLTFHRADPFAAVSLTFGQAFSITGGSNAPQAVPPIPPVVPEPVALALIGSGLSLLVRRRTDA